MKTFLTALLLATFAINARSDNPPAAGAVAPPASSAIVYEIRELTPSGVTQYSNESAIRQYFEFRNGQGTHNIIYEEVAANPPLRNIAALRELAKAWDSTCAVDIECTSKAFCTGDCRNMYYETSNAAGDSLSPDRNKCKVTYISCEPKNPQAVHTPASAPAPVPAPTN